MQYIVGERGGGGERNRTLVNILLWISIILSTSCMWEPFPFVNEYISLNLIKEKWTFYYEYMIAL